MTHARTCITSCSYAWTRCASGEPKCTSCQADGIMMLRMGVHGLLMLLHATVHTVASMLFMHCSW